MTDAEFCIYPIRHVRFPITGICEKYALEAHLNRGALGPKTGPRTKLHCSIYSSTTRCAVDSPRLHQSCFGRRRLHGRSTAGNLQRHTEGLRQVRRRDQEYVGLHSRREPMMDTVLVKNANRMMTSASRSRPPRHAPAPPARPACRPIPRPDPPAHLLTAPTIQFIIDPQSTGRQLAFPPAVGYICTTMHK